MVVVVGAGDGPAVVTSANYSFSNLGLAIVLWYSLCTGIITKKGAQHNYNCLHDWIGLMIIITKGCLTRVEEWDKES